MLLLALSVAVSVAAQRRRAVSQVGPACVEAELATPFITSDLAVDSAFLYFTDENGGIYRLPKTGGQPLLVTRLTDGSNVLSMVVDDRAVYFTTVSADSFLSNVDSVSKTGGTPTVLASGVVTPADLLADNDFLYWTSVGTPTADGQDFQADGKVERMRKDGSGRQTLASGLSFPLGFAIDNNTVYFGETGLALGDTSAGLRSVPKNGGSVTTIIDGVPTITVAVDATTIYVGTVQITGGTVFTVSKSNTSVRKNLSSDSGGIPIALRLAGDQLYYYFLGDTDSIRAVPIAGGDTRILRTGDFATSEFAVDECAIFYGSLDTRTDLGVIHRTPR